MVTRIVIETFDTKYFKDLNEIGLNYLIVYLDE